MIATHKVSLNYGQKILFENVNIKFTPGNCYGLIGANGAGKSTFLKILSGEIDDYSGEIEIPQKCRLSTLKQEHNAFDDKVVLETVIMGDTALSGLIQERDIIYAKEDFSDADGLKAGELEESIEEHGGYEAESNAKQLLSGLGVKENLHSEKMGNLRGSDKVKVLLAQSLFGSPDILLLDEPTNNLDLFAIKWLEEFLLRFDKTVIVVSHDRHFLNKVCTHMADIDFSKITLFVGNYDFWYESSQLVRKLQKDQKQKAEDKAAQLKDFIARFSANASKSKQATGRKKELAKLNLDNIKASTRKFPFIDFKPEREAGNDLLHVDSFTIAEGDKKFIEKTGFEIRKNDKVACMGDELAISKLFEALAQKESPDGIKWGVTTSRAWFPADYSGLFSGAAGELSLIDWLRQYSTEKDESYIRGFLGRMLFAGEEGTKQVKVLSGGEKVRMMFSKLMMTGANVLIFDNPTAHLDLEAIQTLNDAMVRFPGTIIFTSHDHQFLDTIANRIAEIKDGHLKMIDKSFDEYVGIQQ
ncbi:MAG: ATP-binding cassette domain-containing protein [Leptospirales bacterium]